MTWIEHGMEVEKMTGMDFGGCWRKSHQNFLVVHMWREGKKNQGKLVIWPENADACLWKQRKGLEGKAHSTFIRGSVWEVAWGCLRLRAEALTSCFINHKNMIYVVLQFYIQKTEHFMLVSYVVLYFVNKM